ncbi:MAG: hypothetical protein ABIO95_07615 [Bdellovibrionota bacterium]
MNLKKKLFNALVLSAAAASFQSAHAQEESNLQVKGKVWSQFTYDLTKDSDHKNGFDIYRAFLQADYKFGPEWSTTLILDGARTGAPKDYLGNYVRNAYVQQSGLLGEGSSFRFGLQPTAYISTIDGTMKTRWLGKNLVDQTSLVPSQDAGASLAAKAGVLGYGVTVRNGTEGLTKPGNSDNALSYDAWVSAKGFAGGALEDLGVVVYDSVKSKSTIVGSTDTSSNLLAAAVTLSNSTLDAAAELALRRQNDVNATGYGLTLNFKADEEFALYARFFAGNKAFQTGALASKNLLTVGPTYAFANGKVSTGLLFENAPTVIAGGITSRKVLWNWAANF